MSSSEMRESFDTADALSLPPIAEVAWFFDVDGTLLELGATPGAVACDAALATLLLRLREVSGSALALISGRSTAAIDALFAPLSLPVAGEHGVERRSVDGTTYTQAADIGSLAAIRPLLLAWTTAHPGVLIEDKGHSLAMHFRQAPVHATALREYLSPLVAAFQGRLRLQPGKMVLEVTAADADKGRAINAFLDEWPFTGRYPVFIGDDQTDESGFRMVNSLGGLSIKVGEGATSAARRLPDVNAVRAWLGAVAWSGS